MGASLKVLGTLTKPTNSAVTISGSLERGTIIVRAGQLTTRRIRVDSLVLDGSDTVDPALSPASLVVAATPNAVRTGETITGGLSRFSSDRAPTEGWSRTVPLREATVIDSPVLKATGPTPTSGGEAVGTMPTVVAAPAVVVPVPAAESAAGRVSPAVADAVAAELAQALGAAQTAPALSFDSVAPVLAWLESPAPPPPSVSALPATDRDARRAPSPAARRRERIET